MALATLVETADSENLWGAVIPMLSCMHEDALSALAEIISALPPRVLEGMATAALMGEHWDEVLSLVARMSPEKHGEMAEIARHYGEVDPELGQRLSRMARQQGMKFAV